MLYQRCATLKIGRQILFHNVETTLIRSLNVGWDAWISELGNVLFVIFTVIVNAILVAQRRTEAATEGFL